VRGARQVDMALMRWATGVPQESRQSAAIPLRERETPYPLYRFDLGLRPSLVREEF